MTINEIVIATITPIQSNVWANVLPDEPEFPAIAIDVETVPETGWVQGGGYDQHTVTVYYFAKELALLMTMVQSVRNAIEARPEFLVTGECTDADYEDDAEVFAYLTTHTLRMRT